MKTILDIFTRNKRKERLKQLKDLYKSTEEDIRIIDNMLSQDIDFMVNKDNKYDDADVINAYLDYGPRYQLLKDTCHMLGCIKAGIDLLEKRI